MVSKISFTDKLIEIQNKEGYVDQKMADLIGCNRELYRGTKKGRLPIGLTILKGSVKAFPELIGDAIYFLTDGANIVTPLPKDTTTPYQKPLQRFLGASDRFFRGLLRRG